MDWNAARVLHNTSFNITPVYFYHTRYYSTLMHWQRMIEQFSWWVTYYYLRNALFLDGSLMYGTLKCVKLRKWKGIFKFNKINSTSLFWDKFMSSNWLMESFNILYLIFLYLLTFYTWHFYILYHFILKFLKLNLVPWIHLITSSLIKNNNKDTNIRRYWNSNTVFLCHLPNYRSYKKN